MIGSVFNLFLGNWFRAHVSMVSTALSPKCHGSNAPLHPGQPLSGHPYSPCIGDSCFRTPIICPLFYPFIHPIASHQAPPMSRKDCEDTISISSDEGQSPQGANTIVVSNDEFPFPPRGQHCVIISHPGILGNRNELRPDQQQACFFGYFCTHHVVYS